MPQYVMVDDPTYQGQGPAPKTLRSWAMRSLFDAGMPIGEIARKYGLTYHRAYNAIHPPLYTPAKAPSLEAIALEDSIDQPAPPTYAEPEQAEATRVSKGGRPLTHYTRAQLMKMNPTVLKKHALSKQLEADEYGELVGEVCDQRLGPGWWDG